MDANSVVLKLNLDLPETLFKKPQLEATIAVDPDKVSAPVITSKILDNIQEALQKSVGANLGINVIEDITQGSFHIPNN